MLLAACSQDFVPKGDGPMQDEDATTPELSYTWGSAALSVRIWGDPGTAYRVGLTESGAHLDAPRTAEGCWTADSFCHEIPEGSEAVIDYGGDPDAPSPGATAFDLASNDDVTWVVRTSSFRSCWVFGADVTAYAGEGCVELREGD